MFNVFDVSDALVNHIRTSYPDDIAIIAYYGSYAQGTATKRSDLDFFFIPATSRGYRASIQFIVNEISFDFWPISWERAENMAALKEPNTTIIADCHLLYVRSDGDQARFMKLRDKIRDMCDPKNGRLLTERAETLLCDANTHLNKMSSSNDNDMTFFRLEAHAVLTKVLESLALLNETYYTAGWGKNMDQILLLPFKPARVEMLVDKIIKAQEASTARQACEELLSEALKLVLIKKETYATASSYPDRMLGFYEEVKGVLDKVASACERNDYSTAYYWAIGVQDEIARFLYFAEKGQWPGQLDDASAYHAFYNQFQFPDLIKLLNPDDLTPLLKAVGNLNYLLERHLKKHEVKINRFETIREFEAFLNDRKE
ncbi:nucleotidyltransferase domain-containing protein [Paenibacillus sp. sptzw28]|uniref:nucleotidyltransferase domain-containing protein n=1 Tax=Paenibacillus sp. sptzw28 TaxID=715179 RepID=UPI001C6EF00B|nr:nucleotidyltransferase domain-containing protein [Paenibacillus sp. sptzw28]QYR23589.1 nucleotidyltransferase domain-containing protein [Paenibacillus sp. sptzw28]